MAPSDDDLEQALLDATYQVYRDAPDDTSVNKVRKQAEENLGLDDGFFASGGWKKKSKDVIKARVEKLLDGWVPDNKDGAASDDEADKGVKRGSSEIESPQPKPKRQKRGPKPKKPAKKVESEPSELSELTELSELSEEEKPQKKKRAPAKRKTKAKAKAKPVVSDDEDVDMESDNGKPASEDEGEDEKAKNGEAVTEEPAVSTAHETPGDDEKPTTNENGDDKPAVDEEEEYSDVIDEPVKPKRKRKDKKEAASKPTKVPKAVTKKSTTAEDPNTEEIKRLQSHLMKCGVRKLWHNELKKYGDDPKAKIRHLKKMLAEIGMEGRFSEAKAREIKERRELMAEAEAAQEMNALWGVASRGRASRSKSKQAKVVESEGSDAGGDDAEEEEDTYAARRKRARADLAFLGDDSDSE
ncbi:hypothetical protein LCI18_000276 [Fusarium solani-melongenae]|uniref:Uncharacterized protein n=1 Tax=Fusarium solani subsp. cucurbitae TaxID=2747967 RepID=A0ACD3YKF3_FUSSC|nr:hypothetical protein LCI18_000276 [Fusarium solani-melongenae]